MPAHKTSPHSLASFKVYRYSLSLLLQQTAIMKIIVATFYHSFFFIINSYTQQHSSEANRLYKIIDDSNVVMIRHCT
jgi:hypothetical protein